MVRILELKIPPFLISILRPCIFLLFFKFGCGSAGSGWRNRSLTNFTFVGQISDTPVVNRNKAFGPSSFSDDDIGRKSSEDIINIHQHMDLIYQNTSKTLQEYDIGPEVSKYDDKFIISTQLVIQLAQCRSNCIDKFGGGESLAATQRSLESRDDSSISTCWHTCQLLEEEGRTDADGSGIQKPNVLCSLSSKLCLRGCQEACGFHFHPQNLLRSSLSHAKVSDSGLRFHPVIAIPVEPSLSITSVGDKDSLIQWPSTTMHKDQQNLVYTLVQPSSSGWEVAGEQTVLNHVTVPRVDNPLTLRVLAVNSHGLAQVFSHRPTIQRQEATAAAEKGVDLWHLRLNSLVHQKFLVVTEVRWDFPQELISHHQLLPSFTSSTGTERRRRRRRNAAKLKNANNGTSGFMGAKDGAQEFVRADEKKAANFLLTWEVYGGLVRGHLVTEMNVVTVSLWPDTSYSLQVGLIDEHFLGLDKGESSITQMESLLSSGGELPVRMRSNTLSINTSLAEYPLVKKSLQGEWKRSTQELTSTRVGGSSIKINLTSPMEKVGGEEGTGSSGRFCNWKLNQHPISSDDELRTCILIWGILTVCLIIIFLMFLYFSAAVYLAIKQQTYFQKLHTTCSVSSIYSRQFYRLRKNIFRKNGHRRNLAALGIGASSAAELLNFSDSSDTSSDSEDEEMHRLE